MKEPIFGVVSEVLHNILGVDFSEIAPTAALVDDLGADSLDTIELVMAFEEALDMEIPDGDADRIRTVQDIVDYLKEHSPKFAKEQNRG